MKISNYKLFVGEDIWNQATLNPGDEGIISYDHTEEAELLFNELYFRDRISKVENIFKNVENYLIKEDYPVTVEDIFDFICEVDEDSDDYFRYGPETLVLAKSAKKVGNCTEEVEFVLDMRPIVAENKLTGYNFIIKHESHNRVIGQFYRGFHLNHYDNIHDALEGFFDKLKMEVSNSCFE